METLFDIAGECRHLSDKEVIYNITDSEEMSRVYNEMLMKNEIFSVESIFEAMTPGRKKVAVAAVEMYKRMKEREVSQAKIIVSKDIYTIMLPLLCDLETEEFWLILCNQAMKVIKKVRLSSGGIDGTYVDMRVLLKHAILNNATCFAVVHNHPSGNIKPSDQDRNLTVRIKRAADTMMIRLVDHVIIADGQFYSFADEGMI